MRRRLSFVGITSLAIASALDAAGCSEAASPTTPLTVWVLEPARPGEPEVPLAGARVAFDPAGGGARIERTTEADGHVTIDADFSRGPASVSALSADHVYVTMLEASPESIARRPNVQGKPPADLVILPPRLTTTPSGASVRVRGVVRGIIAPVTEITLASSGVRGEVNATAEEPGYELQVPRDRAFFLLGHALRTRRDGDGRVVSNDVIETFRIDLPARAADEILDIDLATAPKLSPRELAFVASPPASSAVPFGLRSRGYAAVTSVDSGLTFGVFTRGEIAAGAPSDRPSFDMRVSLVDAPAPDERVVTQVSFVAPDGSSTTRTELGVASFTNGLDDFADPPALRESAVTLREPIALDGFPSGADLEVQVVAGGQLFWLLLGPPGGPKAPSFVVPYRDEATSADVQVFGVSVSALTDRLELSPRPPRDLYRKTATFRDLLVRKR